MILFAVAHPLVHVNATLNAIAAVLLVVGLVMIKQGRVWAHKRVMLTAFCVSIVFLGCYLWYHYLVGSVEFTHPGAIRYVYYVILLTHVVLAMTVPVLAIWTIYLGLRATGSVWAGRRRDGGRGPGRLPGEAPPDGPLDVPDLVVRVGHRGGGLRDAVSPLAAGGFVIYNAGRGRKAPRAEEIVGCSR